MTEKVFVSEDNFATLICPECSKTTTRNVSKYKNLQKLIKLNVVCTCGHPYSVILERRKFYRKPVSLAGKYVFRPEQRATEMGGMTVMDISRVGLRIQFRQVPMIQAGDAFEVEFNLDDKQKSLIRRTVVVRRVDGNCVNAQFSAADPSDPSDKALGFYLF